MNKIKSVFISVSILVSIVFAIVGLSYFLGQHEKVFFFVSFLSPLVYVGFFAYLYIRRPTDVDFAKIFMNVFLGVCFLIAAGRIFFEGDEGKVPLLIVVVTFIFWFLYNRWYSKLSRSDSKLGRGRNLPNFTVTKSSGETVASSSWNGKYNLVIFHRGNWCPFCVAQVRELSKVYQELSSINTDVHFISPQDSHKTSNLAQRFETGTNHYSDEDLKAAEILGIIHQNGLPFGLEVFGFKSNGALPTIIITDENLKILYLNQTEDYRKRPDADQLLTRIKGFQAEKKVVLAV